jgi:hypothetical protein
MLWIIIIGMFIHGTIILIREHKQNKNDGKK